MTSSQLEKIPKLKGEENYQSWATAMTEVWREMKMYHVVVTGERPRSGASKEEMEMYESQSREAIDLFYTDHHHHHGIIDKDIVQKLSSHLRLSDPHVIWRFLEAKYKIGRGRSNAFNALIFEVSNILKDLSDFYNNSSSSQAISTLIEKFEIEWLLIEKLTEDHTTHYPHQRNLFNFILDDEAKCQALLGFLSDHQKEIFNEGHFSYAQAKRNLLSLESKIILNPKASQTATNDCTLYPNSIQSEFESSQRNRQESYPSKLQDEQQTSINPSEEVEDADINSKKISQLKIFKYQVEIKSYNNKSEQPESITKASPDMTNQKISASNCSQKLEIREEERFDYSKAPSLIRGTKREGLWEQSGKKKPFDPYSSNMDVRNGARRPPIFRAGKSHTFRN